MAFLAPLGELAAGGEAAAAAGGTEAAAGGGMLGRLKRFLPFGNHGGGGQQGQPPSPGQQARNLSPYQFRV